MKNITILAFLLPLLLRSLLASHPHSGENNHHGSKTAYGGDYEAQRHWMELCLHLPLSQWYKYDLSYWGLDYPPLIAYGSYVMGWASHTFVGEETVALFDSRGYEEENHKAFMRFTVIFWDAVVYFPMLYILCKRLAQGHDKVLQLVFGAMIQPALIAIDNGHFQYNNVCLGLALGSFHFMTRSDEIGFDDIIGSILFCLALNWKQMALYLAPAVFAFLLGKCFRGGSLQNVVRNIAILGISVVGTFFCLWFPFYHFRQDLSEGIFDVFGPILRRIFPFSRGLFEGKVANIWCVLNVKPFSVRDRIPDDLQPLCALGLTFAMMLPFCILLFSVGRQNITPRMKLKALLWGAAGTSLSFFLASFQVHEKSILFALAPLSLLNAPLNLTQWFSICSTWSLWHLLVTDRLQLAYFALITMYLCFLFLFGLENFADGGYSERISEKKLLSKVGQYIELFLKAFLPSSGVVMVMLHIAEGLVAPPEGLPDLFPVLWTVVGCASFGVMWIASLWILLSFASPSGKLSSKQD